MTGNEALRILESSTAHISRRGEYYYVMIGPYMGFNFKSDETLCPYKEKLVLECTPLGSALK